MGFPIVPDGFFKPTSWNMQLTAEETMGLWRELVRLMLTRYIKRYGTAEVEAWHLESWNEPE